MSKLFDPFGIFVINIFLFQNFSFSPKINLYVAPKGSGTLCTQSAPCSLLTARDRARQISVQTSDIVILMADGIYFYKRRLLWMKEILAKNGFKIIYQAQPGAYPVLSGGRVIMNWQIYNSAKRIYRASSQGIDTRQLYVNGRRAQRAKSPWLGNAFVKENDRWIAQEKPFLQMSSWRNPTQIEFWGYDQWRSIRCPVERIFGQSVFIRKNCWNSSSTKTPALNPWSSVAWVENAFELLDQPGEFYLDRKEGYVYYIPRSDENMNTAFVVAPILQNLVLAHGTSSKFLHDVTFRGVGFAHSTWRAPSGNDGFVETSKNIYIQGSNLKIPRRRCLFTMRARLFSKAVLLRGLEPQV